MAQFAASQESIFAWSELKRWATDTPLTWIQDPGLSSYTCGCAPMVGEHNPALAQFVSGLTQATVVPGEVSQGTRRECSCFHFRFACFSSRKQLQLVTAKHEYKFLKTHTRNKPDDITENTGIRVNTASNLEFKKEGHVNMRLRVCPTQLPLLSLASFHCLEEAMPREHASRGGWGCQAETNSNFFFWEGGWVGPAQFG